MPMTTAVPRWRARLKEIPSEFDEILIPNDKDDIEQDEEWCEVVIDGMRRRLRFHDYDEVYKIRGLYERLFYGKLKCCSPSRTVSLLCEMLDDYDDDVEDLKVLDLGAGNGMVGDELHAREVEMIVGVDILPEAKMAAERDRTGVYDEYHVTDFTDLPEEIEERLRTKQFNCLTSVAALGFGDIPPQAFVKALDLIENSGWIALVIKEDFFREKDTSGFHELIRRLNTEEIIQIQAYRRFRHRVSMTGKPLYYLAMVARKLRDVPGELFLE